MKKLWIFLIASALCPLLGKAQHGEALVQTIRGQVTDQASGESLAGVTIRVADTPASTLTDEQGNFTLQNIPIGRHSVYVHSLGYEPVLIKAVLLESAKEAYLAVALRERIITLTEVEVQPRINKGEALNEMAVTGAQMFSVEEASRFAGGMDDPARLVSAYAGVATPSISNNGISIRGNAPSLLQWRLEGVEIPNPNHFADVDVLGGGFLAALSSNVLGNSDFFVGAFPAAYSNAVSGVFDMQLRKGNNQQYEHTFSLGVLGIDLASEGPISRDAGSSYIVNYRYSTTGLLEKLRHKKDMGGTLGYQDLNVKVHMPTKKAGTFTLWGFGLLDEVAPILEDSSEWKYVDDGIVSGARQRSGAAGLSHQYLFGDRKTSLHTTVAATHLDNSIDEDFYDPSGIKHPRTDMAAHTTNLIFTAMLRHKFNARHTNKTGFTFTDMHYDMRLDVAPHLGETLAPVIRSDGHTRLIAAYTQSLFNLRPDLTLTAGLNVQHLSLGGKSTVEPRVGLRWQVTEKNALAVAYGQHSRMEKLDVYFVKGETGDLPNRDLGFTKSRHLLFSYVYRISDDIHLKIEPYFQSLYQVPVTETGSYSILNRKQFFITETLVGKGRGRNYGVDLTFSRYLDRGLYYRATASLFDSKYLAGDGHWYNTRYNRKFIFKWLIGKEWEWGRDRLSVNLKASLLGGQRHSPVDAAATLADANKEVQYEETSAYAEQFSPMFVGDFALLYTLNRGNVTHGFAVKSVNATGQKEYVGHKYNLNTQLIEPDWTATSVFNVSYRIAF